MADLPRLPEQLRTTRIGTKIGTRIGIGGSSLKSNYKQPATAIRIMTLNVAVDRLKPELQTSEYRLQPEAWRGLQAEFPTPSLQWCIHGLKPAWNFRLKAVLRP